MSICVVVQIIRKLPHTLWKLIVEIFQSCNASEFSSGSPKLETEPDHRQF
jgi:hypothetical protein